MSGELAVARLGLGRDALAGQVAVVTGAGRGVGREAARALAYIGARVVVAEIDEASGAETVALIAAEGGHGLCVRTDVADVASVQGLAERVRSELGRVDVLVNNAVLCPARSLVDMDVEQWDRVIAVNLRGTFLMCRAFLPFMLAQGRGTIVNMVSTDAMPGLSAYMASKRGIAGLSQSLAAEVGERGVRVIAFGPGMVDTPGIRDVAEDLAPRLGMTLEQFLGVSLHTAYDGLMPAGDAGAATANLVARLAGEYHGEVVDGYTVLERAGYLAAAGAGLAASAAAGGPARTGGLEQTLVLARRVREYVAQTEAEFDRLPLFARPMARGDFKSKAGLSTRDWARTCDELVAELERALAGDEDARRQVVAGRERLVALLSKFVTYCRAVPAATARFTKDQEFLRQVSETMAEREATLGELSAQLERLG